MPVNQTNLTALQAILSNQLSRLQDCTANPKPSYSEDGRSVSWTEYQQSLVDQITKTMNLIERENSAAVPAKQVRYHEHWKRWLDRSPIVGTLDKDRNRRV